MLDYIYSIIEAHYTTLEADQFWLFIKILSHKGPGSPKIAQSFTRYGKTSNIYNHFAGSGPKIWEDS